MRKKNQANFNDYHPFSRTWITALLLIAARYLRHIDWYWVISIWREQIVMAMKSSHISHTFSNLFHICYSIYNHLYYRQILCTLPEFYFIRDLCKQKIVRDKNSALLDAGNKSMVVLQYRSYNLWSRFYKLNETYSFSSAVSW